MANYEVLEVEHLTDHAFRLRIERPEEPIRAGQCFNVGVPGMGINREYSMYSAADASHLDFLIYAVEGGLVSSRLQRLQPGDRVEIDGPYGEFCLPVPLPANAQFFFIATGTGIAPFHSFVKTFPELQYQVLHGVRTAGEQYHAMDYRAGSYVACLSQAEEPTMRRRVTDYLMQHELVQDAFYYLCGNRNMIVDAFEILRSKKIPGDQIFTEVFF